MKGQKRMWTHFFLQTHLKVQVTWDVTALPARRFKGRLLWAITNEFRSLVNCNEDDGCSNAYFQRHCADCYCDDRHPQLQLIRELPPSLAVVPFVTNMFP